MLAVVLELDVEVPYEGELPTDEEVLVATSELLCVCGLAGVDASLRWTLAAVPHDRG